jgi:hypothetical protein
MGNEGNLPCIGSQLTYLILIKDRIILKNYKDYIDLSSKYMQDYG